MTREEWLNLCSGTLVRDLFLEHGAAVDYRYRVSVGFPGGGSARKRIGECWSPASSADATAEIFISPILDATRVIDVVGVLIHEHVHASVGNAAGHGPVFRKLATAVGLVGKMTATTCGEALTARIQTWIGDHIPYPHGGLSLSGRKKQSTRLAKCECGGCGYLARVTAKWIDTVGAPICPACELTMTVR